MRRDELYILLFCHLDLGQVMKIYAYIILRGFMGLMLIIGLLSYFNIVVFYRVCDKVIHLHVGSPVVPAPFVEEIVLSP